MSKSFTGKPIVTRQTTKKSSLAFEAEAIKKQTIRKSSRQANPPIETKQKQKQNISRVSSRGTSKDKTTLGTVKLVNVTRFNNIKS